MARSTIVPRAFTKQQLSRLRRQFERELAAVQNRIGVPTYDLSRTNRSTYENAEVRALWDVVHAVALSQYQRGYQAARRLYQQRPAISVTPGPIRGFDNE